LDFFDFFSQETANRTLSGFDTNFLVFSAGRVTIVCFALQVKNYAFVGIAV
jgi:hypothetical protein